jgi:CO/xanthine dehydrogenase Mo-binding subunit
MTEMLNKEFSRKSFVKGGGALIVGFSVLGSALAGKAGAADSPYASNGVDQFQIDSWIAIHADNTASIKTGAIRQGTGAETGLLMIAGEELDMAMSQLKFIEADTNVTPNTGKHSASNTVQNAGPGVRAAAASAKQVLLGLASKQLGVPTTQLSVSSGVVSGGGKSVTYGALLGGKLFNVAMPASYKMAPSSPSGSFSGGTPAVPGQGIVAGQAPAKPVSQYKLVGTSPPRFDIPAIVTGREVYIQNIRLPGMLHGRLVRPRGQAVWGFGAPIVSVDESSIRHIPGVKIVRKNHFLGVVAPDEYAAIQAAAQLKVKWADPPAVLPGGGNEYAQMRALERAGKTVSFRTETNPPAGAIANNGNQGDVDGALASAAHVVSGEYGFPTLAHTPIGPNCAVADVTPAGARIFAGTQGCYQMRPQVAPVLGLPENLIRVTACAMGGCFGDGAQYYDTAVGAAIMSQAVGAPVRVQLMRWDEIGWTRMGPGSLMDVRAGIDSQGNLVAFDFTHIYPQGSGDTVQMNAVLAGEQREPAGARLAFWPAPMYNIPNRRFLVKSIQIEGNWISGGALRGIGSPNVIFAGEQVIDELAHAAKMDPVAFRIQNVVQGNNWANAGQCHDQLLSVLNAVAKAANWQPTVSASNLSDANVVTGRGVAWANVERPYIRGQTAAIADVEVNKKTGKVTVKHVYQAMNAGLAVYPDGIANQISGGTIMGVSWVLSEQLRFSRTNVMSGDFVTYPILRFKDAPKVTPIVIQWGDKNAFTGGVGEPPSLLIPAAVANAFFDATGVRMRTAPMTPARVRATLKAAGVA